MSDWITTTTRNIASDDNALSSLIDLGKSGYDIFRDQQNARRQYELAKQQAMTPVAPAIPPQYLLIGAGAIVLLLILR